MSEKSKTIEMVALEDKARYSRLETKELADVKFIDIEIEEDLLVPDTEPDMGMILNVSGKVKKTKIHSDDLSSKIKGEISLEILYHSADIYNDKLINIESSPAFEKIWDGYICEDPEIDVTGRIIKIEHRVINERKYRVKVLMQLRIDEISACERNFFEGIEGEDLELLKEEASIMSLAFSKTIDKEINETLTINNDNVKPVKILKSVFRATENHRQLTSDKLVVNETIWIRIIYVAEITSPGGFSNQPMLYTGKIDNTQFVPLDAGYNVSTCSVSSDVSNLTAEINGNMDGFTVSGGARASASFYEVIQKEIVTDFYNKNEEMVCDNNAEQVYRGIELIKAEQTLQETIGLDIESPEMKRIVFMDASVQNVEVVESEYSAAINGKITIEVLTMTEGNQPSIAKKICDFEIPVNLPEGNRFVPGCRIFVREMTGEIVNQNQISVTVQLQVEVDVFVKGQIKLISNPCIVREETQKKNYPVILYTVKQNDNLWDIAKKYRVPVERIMEINKTETIREGMKIVVAK